MKLGDNFKISEKTKSLLISGFLFTGFIVLVAWMIDIIIHNYPLSFATILYLHVNNPIVFFVDALPIIVCVVIIIHGEHSDRIEKELYQKIESLESTITKNAEFAQKIGEGDFSTDESLITKGILGKSLVKMRDNLLANSIKEKERAWITKGKDGISHILRSNYNIKDIAYQTLVGIIKYVDVVQGAFYLFREQEGELENVATYAFSRRKYLNAKFALGQGLIGQAALEKNTIYRTEIPDEYVTISSGILGDKKPYSILIVPLIGDEKLQGVIELASLEEIPELVIQFLEELSGIIGQTVHNIQINEKTANLLIEAQEMTRELKKNEEELQMNAKAMRLSQESLKRTNYQLELNVQEVINAQKRLQELLENASEVISIYDENGFVIFESPSVEPILGYKPKDIIGKYGFSRVSAEDRERVIEILAFLLDNPTEKRIFEMEYIKSDGSKIWLEATGRNLINNPAVGGILFNTRDITVRKIAEREQQMRGQMQALSENSRDLIIRFDINGTIFYANPMLESTTGVKLLDIIQLTIDGINFDDKVSSVFKEVIKEVSKTEIIVEREETIPTVDGDRIIQINAIPEFNDSGVFETVLFVGHDITERKLIELEIQDKNRKIGDSINYAKRIQSSILPADNDIHQLFPDSFIFYKPRDVVSGDFPWMYISFDYTCYIAAVDCTGHGVPGALLSFIGYYCLNNILSQYEDITCKEVLDKLHAEVRKTLKQDGDSVDSKDGMDIALCRINLKDKELQFSGAHRSLLLLRNKELLEFKGARKAIGGVPPRIKAEKPFENHVINIEPNDRIFFFSDGLPDQTDRTNLKKYSSQRIRDAIIQNSDKPISYYSEYFYNDFMEWKGDQKQIDDILMIGIEFGKNILG